MEGHEPVSPSGGTSVDSMAGTNLVGAQQVDSINHTTAQTIGNIGESVYHYIINNYYGNQDPNNGLSQGYHSATGHNAAGVTPPMAGSPQHMTTDVPPSPSVSTFQTPRPSQSRESSQISSPTTTYTGVPSAASSPKPSRSVSSPNIPQPGTREDALTRVHSSPTYTYQSSAVHTPTSPRSDPSYPTLQRYPSGEVPRRVSFSTTRTDQSETPAVHKSVSPQSVSSYQTAQPASPGALRSTISPPSILPYQTAQPGLCRESSARISPSRSDPENPLGISSIAHGRGGEQDVIEDLRVDLEDTLSPGPTATTQDLQILRCEAFDPTYTLHIRSFLNTKDSMPGNDDHPPRSMDNNGGMYLKSLLDLATPLYHKDHPHHTKRNISIVLLGTKDTEHGSFAKDWCEGKFRVKKSPRGTPKGLHIEGDCTVVDERLWSLCGLDITIVFEELKNDTRFMETQREEQLLIVLCFKMMGNGDFEAVRKKWQKLRRDQPSLRQADVLLGLSPRTLAVRSAADTSLVKREDGEKAATSLGVKVYLECARRNSEAANDVFSTLLGYAAAMSFRR